MTTFTACWSVLNEHICLNQHQRVATVQVVQCTVQLKERMEHVSVKS